MTAFTPNATINITFQGDRLKTYIALLRGINVGGKNVLPMRELVAILESMGAQSIKTYIQSGNAVFQSDDLNLSQCPQRLSAEIKQRHGFEPRVQIIGLAALETAITNNPFAEAEADPSNLHLGFLDAEPENPDLVKLDALRADNERFQLLDRVFYLHAPEGVGRSKR